MGVNIQFSQSYFWLNSWIMANMMQFTTQDLYVWKKNINFVQI